MPIEIKELHIKINVSEQSERPATRQTPAQSKDKIIEACVEQVMEILAKKGER